MKQFLLATVAAAALALPATANEMDRQSQNPGQQQMQSQAQQDRSRIQPANLSQSEVQQIQQALNRKGFDAGNTDGHWGPETSAALKNFQEKQNMQSADGQLDHRTLSALGVQVAQNGSQGQDRDWEQTLMEPSGLNSEEISQIQQALNKKGFDAGNVDGEWGPETEAALKNFQERQNMQTADGQLDEPTLSALGVQFAQDGSGAMETTGSGAATTGSGAATTGSGSATTGSGVGTTGSGGPQMSEPPVDQQNNTNPSR